MKSRIDAFSENKGKISLPYQPIPKEEEGNPCRYFPLLSPTCPCPNCKRARELEKRDEEARRKIKEG